MPLYDLFHPPISVYRPYSGIYSSWANNIAFELNRSELPEGYFAMAAVHPGGSIEIDTAVFNGRGRNDTHGNDGGGWSAPEPLRTSVVDLKDLDVFEVRVVREDGDLSLVAAIELVSPSNKDRPASRHAFANKCAAHLQQGVCVVIVDVVTEKGGDLYKDVLERIDTTDEKEVDFRGWKYLFVTFKQNGVRKNEIVGCDKDAKTGFWMAGSDSPFSYAGNDDKELRDFDTMRRQWTNQTKSE